VTPKSIQKAVAGIDPSTSKVLADTSKARLNEVLTQAQNSVDDI